MNAEKIVYVRGLWVLWLVLCVTAAAHSQGQGSEPPHLDLWFLTKGWLVGTAQAESGTALWAYDRESHELRTGAVSSDAHFQPLSFLGPDVFYATSYHGRGKDWFAGWQIFRWDVKTGYKATVRLPYCAALARSDTRRNRGSEPRVAIPYGDDVLVLADRTLLRQTARRWTLYVNYYWLATGAGKAGPVTGMRDLKLSMTRKSGRRVEPGIVWAWTEIWGPLGAAGDILVAERGLAVSSGPDRMAYDILRAAGDRVEVVASFHLPKMFDVKDSPEYPSLADATMFPGKKRCLVLLCSEGGMERDGWSVLAFIDPSRPREGIQRVVELPNTLGISYDVWRQLCVWPELVLADIAHKRIPFQFDLSGDLLAWASADHELVIQQFDQEGLGRSVRVSVPESFGVVKEVLLSQEGDALAVSSVDGPWKVYRLDFPKIHEEAGARILLNAEVVARDLAGAMEP